MNIVHDTIYQTHSMTDLILQTFCSLNDTCHETMIDTEIDSSLKMLICITDTVHQTHSTIIDTIHQTQYCN